MPGMQNPLDRELAFFEQHKSEWLPQDLISEQFLPLIVTLTAEDLLRNGSILKILQIP